MKNKEIYVKVLQERGLSKSEAETFMDLLNKINPTKEDFDSFEYEMNQGICFEGGMGFTEALAGLKLNS